MPGDNITQQYNCLKPHCHWFGGISLPFRKADSHCDNHNTLEGQGEDKQCNNVMHYKRGLKSFAGPDVKSLLKTSRTEEKDVPDRLREFHFILLRQPFSALCTSLERARGADAAGSVPVPEVDGVLVEEAPAAV